MKKNRILLALSAGMRLASCGKGPSSSTAPSSVEPAPLSQTSSSGSVPSSQPSQSSTDWSEEIAKVMAEDFFGFALPDFDFEGAAKTAPFPLSAYRLSAGIMRELKPPRRGVNPCLSTCVFIKVYRRELKSRNKKTKEPAKEKNNLNRP